MDAIEWERDHLGDGFSMATLELPPDDEGPCVATLVSYRAAQRRGVLERTPWRRARTVRAVLYLHGWSDYFFHTGLAKFFHRQGMDFFAVDLRKHGRSLRTWQTPGFVTDLDAYDADLDAATAAVAATLAARYGPRVQVSLTLMAHSTGALTAALWADRFPGRVSSLILNSPWLDSRNSALLRATGQGILEPLTKVRPRARLRLPELGFYWRSISREADGEWDLHPLWRPEFGFPIRAGWLAAVLAGHYRVARGLNISVPLLVLASARSDLGPVWSGAKLETDSVLDVRVMVRRAAQLGRTVTICRFDGALHDVLLSREPVRSHVYGALENWLQCLGQEPVGN